MKNTPHRIALAVTLGGLLGLSLYVTGYTYWSGHYLLSAGTAGVTVILLGLATAAQKAAEWVILPRRYARPVETISMGFRLVSLFRRESDPTQHPLVDATYYPVKFDDGGIERVYWSDLYMAISTDIRQGRRNFLSQRWVAGGKLSRRQWEAMRWLLEQARVVRRNGRGELIPMKSHDATAPLSAARVIETVKLRLDI